MIDVHGIFADIFKNAKENSVIVMDEKGIMLQINPCFLSVFGYKEKFLLGKNFAILFTEKDRAAKRPQNEVKIALDKGSMSDNNYLLHKDGTNIWVMGESICVKNVEGKKFLVKIIQNINTQKKLERVLLESNEFLNTIFDSVKDAAFIVLNSELRIIRTNKAFIRIFQLKKAPEVDTKLSLVENSFWRKTELRSRIAQILVKGKGMKNVPYLYINAEGKESIMEITSKILNSDGLSRSILLVIRPNC